MDGWMHGWMDGCMHVYMDGWVGRYNGCMHGYMNGLSMSSYFFLLSETLKS